MKKVIGMMIGLLFLMACNHGDINKVKPGMSSKEVAGVMGEPSKKQPMMMGIEWWFYGENQCVVMAHDSVVNVVPDVKKTRESMERIMKDHSDDANTKKEN